MTDWRDLSIVRLSDISTEKIFRVLAVRFVSAVLLYIVFLVTGISWCIMRLNRAY